MENAKIFTTLILTTLFSISAFAAETQKNCRNSDPGHGHKFATVGLKGKTIQFLALEPKKNAPRDTIYYVDRCSKITSTRNPVYICFDSIDGERAYVQLTGRSLKVWSDDNEKAVTFVCE